MKLVEKVSASQGVKQSRPRFSYKRDRRRSEFQELLESFMSESVEELEDYPLRLPNPVRFSILGHLLIFNQEKTRRTP